MGSRVRRAVPDMAGIVAAVILSIEPPGDALSLAEQLAPALRHAKPGLIYADCNAVSPQPVERVEAAVAPGGIRFVDAGIIGGPSKPGSAGPVFYASGEHAAGLTLLAQHGLTIKLLDRPVGAASGLKMSYAGITKGLTALTAAMMLSASRFGAASDRAAELVESQPELLAQFRRQVPGMYPKAYRWVAEMQEVAAFAGGMPASSRSKRGWRHFVRTWQRTRRGPARHFGAGCVPEPSVRRRRLPRSCNGARHHPGAGRVRGDASRVC